MLTRFVSDSAWGSPEYIYPYDNTVSLKNKKLYVSGNLNVNFVPFLEDINDFANNNYSIFYLTNKRPLSSFVDVKISEFGGESNSYNCLLGVFLEDGLMKETTRFLECIPLYRHVNDFEVFYASFNNTYTQLSGGSLVFSSVDPALSAFEVGFSINNTLPVYNNKKVQTKYKVNAQASMQTTASNLSSTLAGTIGFVRYLSGYVNEFGTAQTIRLTLSALSANNAGVMVPAVLNADTLKGTAFTIGNTYYGNLTSSESIGFYRRFCFSFHTLDSGGNFTRFFPAGGYTENERYSVPHSLLPPITMSSSIRSIVDALSSRFDPTKTGDDFCPASVFFGVRNIEFGSHFISMTIFNKLSGSIIEPAGFYNGLGIPQNVSNVKVLTEGRDSGFYLRFGKKPTYTTTDFKVPTDYYSYNTVLNVSAISDFYSTQIANHKEYSYKSNFIDIFGDSNNIFFDFNTLNDKEVTITHSLYKRKAYLVSDDLSKKLYFIDSQFISEANIAIATFNYIFDPETKRVIIYRIIEDRVYALTINGSDLSYRLLFNLADVPEESVFSLFKFDRLSLDFQKNIWGSYTRSVNTNSIDLDRGKSYNVENNFLIHSEYSKSNKDIQINVLPLKNQLNDFYEQGRKKDSVDFRSYHSIYTGDNTETGNSNISLGYVSNNKQYVFKSGQISWFHIPYNESYKRIKINDANFVVNGAIPGSSPVFSDKIYKKVGDYKYKSNLGDSNLEQTGQWLCAWLSGGKDGSNAVWLDRFYNPEIITEIEAIKVTNNVDYIPSYTTKDYKEGITDRISTMTLEPGVWYAYNHIGKDDAYKVINYIKKDLIQEGVIGINPNSDGEYVIAGKNSGYISIENYKAPLNNFTLSFFGHSEDWNQPMGNQIIGNYVDNGFGIFNYNQVNPLTYYFNKDRLIGLNDENRTVLTCLLPPSLSGNIIGMFRRNYHQNFHVILKTLDILEYNLEGTLVDSVRGVEINDRVWENPIIDIANNENTGVILFADLSYVKIDLKSNAYKNFDQLEEAFSVNFNDQPNTNFSVCMDPFDTVYIVAGRAPVVRQDKIYFIDNIEPRHLRVYNILEQKSYTYIDTSNLEQSPTSPKTYLSFSRENQTYIANPYTTFNLTNLSGVSFNLSPGDNRIYNIGFSIYKQPYIFYNPVDGSTKYVPSNPIYVDLHGNFWYEQDKITPAEAREVYNSEKMGYSTNIDLNNFVLMGDPEYNERLGGTDRKYGKVFGFYINDEFRLNSAGAIDLGPQPQKFKFIFDGGTRFDILSTFGLSATMIFTNGSDVFSTPYGNSLTYRPFVSAFSLAFTLPGTQPHHIDQTIFNKFTAALTPPMTAMGTIVEQLTTIFTQDIIPHPTGLQALSTFFDFSIARIGATDFEIDVLSKMEGAPLSGKSMAFGASNFFSQSDQSYTVENLQPGIEPIGQIGQQFGWQVFASPPGTEEKPTTDRVCPYVVVTSPGWILNGLTIGKMTVYENAVFGGPNTLVSFTSSYDIRSPLIRPDVNFGFSMAGYPWYYFRPYYHDDPTKPLVSLIMPIIVGAPTTNPTIYPTNSAFVYQLHKPSEEATPTQRAIDKLSITFTGPSSAAFAYDVEINGRFFAISSPKHRNIPGNTTGAVKMIKFDDEGYVTQIIYTRDILPSGPRYRFGHSIKFMDDYTIAIGSLGVSPTARDCILVDVYTLDKETTQFTLLSTLSSDFTNLSAGDFDQNENVRRMDIGATKKQLAVSVWRGNTEVFGDEDSKIKIWYKAGNEFYDVWTQYDENNNPLVFKNFKGRSLSLVDDRLIAGTTFIYNTGNSFAFVVSSINTAIELQTKRDNLISSPSLFTGQTTYVDNREFRTTITTHISAEDAARPQLYQHINKDYLKDTLLLLYDYHPGSSVIYSGKILNFDFNKEEETIILVDFNKTHVYDILGDYKTTFNLNKSGLPATLSCIRFSICSLIENQKAVEKYSYLAASTEKELYAVTFDPLYNTIMMEMIDTNFEGNPFFFPYNQESFDTVVKYNFDITNHNYITSVVRLTDEFPTLTFKIKLSNRLDAEQSDIFSPKYNTENLSRGWHHFAVVLDSVNGEYLGYIDGRQIFKKEFPQNKYVFSSILKNNISVGASPFLNNVIFDNFYKSRSPKFIANGIKFSDIKFYNKPLNQEEINFLTYEKFEPSNLKLQLEYGYRNYIDTISRVSRHKVPGRKSQLIDVHINDSLITDRELQRYYETKIITELRETLPAYVKINKIVWNVNKPADFSIQEGDINTGNTLTNVGGF